MDNILCKMKFYRGDQRSFENPFHFNS
jgi:hypothetical protein